MQRMQISSRWEKVLIEYEKKGLMDMCEIGYAVWQ